MKNDAYVSEETDQNTAEERLDLSQFEGHVPGPWVLDNEEVKPLGVILNEDTPDARLIAAAPELLAELIETRKELEWFKQAMTLSNEGFELSDGGTICFPDSGGRIERVDYWGNTVEARSPGQPGYEDWNRLMGDKAWRKTED